jgi:GH24 family phage-related lysozyme (muramidase)
MNRFKENMIRQLTRHEGLRLKPYLCPAGKLTIGIGRNLEARNFPQAAAQMKASRWYRQVGKRAETLTAMRDKPSIKYLRNLSGQIYLGRISNL